MENPIQDSYPRATFLLEIVDQLSPYEYKQFLKLLDQKRETDHSLDNDIGERESSDEEDVVEPATFDDGPVKPVTVNEGIIADILFFAHRLSDPKRYNISGFEKWFWRNDAKWLILTITSAYYINGKVHVIENPERDSFSLMNDNASEYFRSLCKKNISVEDFFKNYKSFYYNCHLMFMSNIDRFYAFMSKIVEICFDKFEEFALSRR
jgi:hypothetical protein